MTEADELEVLSILDEISCLLAEPAAARLDAARTKVSRLFEEAKADAVAFGCFYGSTGVHFVSDDRNECVEESRRDGSLVVDLIVRPGSMS